MTPFLDCFLLAFKFTGSILGLLHGHGQKMSGDYTNAHYRHEYWFTLWELHPKTRWVLDTQ